MAEMYHGQKRKKRFLQICLCLLAKNAVFESVLSLKNVTF